MKILNHIFLLKCLHILAAFHQKRGSDKMVEVVVTEALILSPLPGEDDLEKVGLEKVGLEKVGLEKVFLEKVGSDQGGLGQGELGQGGAGDHGQGGAPAPQLLPPHLHD